MDSKDLFERLKSGDTISPGDPEAHKMRDASFATKELLIRMNNTADPTTVRYLLSQITGSAIDESVAVFTPLYFNYGKHTRMGKTCLSISTVSSSTWEVLR